MAHLSIPYHNQVLRTVVLVQMTDLVTPLTLVQEQVKHQCLKIYIHQQ